MKSLYFRIYLTVVAVLLLFAAASGLLFQRQIESERLRSESVLGERFEAWAELLQRSLPGAETPPAEQAAALRDWSQRLRLPLALDDAQGRRVATSDSFERRQDEAGLRGAPLRLADGRTLWIMRRGAGMRLPPGMHRGPGGPSPWPFLPPWWQRGTGLVLLLALLFVAIAVAAYPVVRRLTRRLEALQRGVERFGAGELGHRVEVSGRDEVASVAASFNQAAAKVEALVRSHQSLLANASHELRSPLARMKMAVSMLDDATPTRREQLKHEIHTNVAELDALVEEVLLASRLDAAKDTGQHAPVDLLALAAEEAARVDALVEGQALAVQGDERLLRRALRNLLENARRYGGGEIAVHICAQGGSARLQVCDRGPGVPEAYRERIFEPFYRLPGHAEKAGGVGLGLSLVRQIAQAHGGSVRCEPHAGGGSCFVLSLPQT